MSVTATKWAWDQARAGRVAGPELVTLLAFADQANDEGYGWVGYDVIVAMTNQGYRTVQRHAAQLVELTLMERARRNRKSGRRGKYEYWLAVHEQPLLREVHHRPNSTTGQNGRSVKGGHEEGQASPHEAAVSGDPDHRPNSTTGQNGHWHDLATQPPATGGHTVPVKHKTLPTHRPCACARARGGSDHERFVAFDCGHGDELVYCEADVVALQTTFPRLTADDVRQTLREIGAWYHDECRDPDNPHGRVARMPHEWKRLVRRWLSERQASSGRESGGQYGKTAAAVAALEGARRGG